MLRGENDISSGLAHFMNKTLMPSPQTAIQNQSDTEALEKSNKEMFSMPPMVNLGVEPNTFVLKSATCRSSINAKL